MESLTGKIAAAALSLLALGGLATMVYQASQSSVQSTAMVTAAVAAAQSATTAPPAAKDGSAK